MNSVQHKQYYLFPTRVHVYFIFKIKNNNAPIYLFSCLLYTSQLAEADNWTYCAENVKTKQHLVDIKSNVKNSQFATPLFEFSGACSGCGETPYVKLISQLFGDREMVANATGCSSIYSGSVPSTPYTTNENGHGPAWANSLFEDFCEFGLGMELANEKMRARIVKLFNEILAADNASPEAKEVLKAWIENMYDADKTKELAPQVKAVIEEGLSHGCPICKELKGLTQYLVKRSQWIIGGDGASYDIGYGGLDHVIASGKDVNILVLDTEVYSNTGGQSSKATPVGAIAKFAAAGKRVRKKDLGLMATTYGYVYVAQIAMGADQAQTLKAIREAEAYPGPSLIIAYAPCINPVSYTHLDVYKRQRMSYLQRTERTDSISCKTQPMDHWW